MVGVFYPTLAYYFFTSLDIVALIINRKKVLFLVIFLPHVYNLVHCHVIDKQFTKSMLASNHYWLPVLLPNCRECNKRGHLLIMVNSNQD